MENYDGALQGLPPGLAEPAGLVSTLRGRWRCVGAEAHKDGGAVAVARRLWAAHGRLFSPCSQRRLCVCISRATHPPPLKREVADVGMPAKASHAPGWQTHRWDTGPTSIVLPRHSLALGLPGKHRSRSRWSDLASSACASCASFAFVSPEWLSKGGSRDSRMTREERESELLRSPLRSYTRRPSSRLKSR